VTPYRCRLLGILIGLGVASSVASTYVIDRYKASQQELLVAVQQLQQSTDQVSWSYGHDNAVCFYLSDHQFDIAS
jgi:hypothetical protein